MSSLCCADRSEESKAAKWKSKDHKNKQSQYSRLNRFSLLIHPIRVAMVDHQDRTLPRRLIAKRTAVADDSAEHEEE